MEDVNKIDQKTVCKMLIYSILSNYFDGDIDKQIEVLGEMKDYIEETWKLIKK